MKRSHRPSAMRINLIAQNRLSMVPKWTPSNAYAHTKKSIDVQPRGCSEFWIHGGDVHTGAEPIPSLPTRRILSSRDVAYARRKARASLMFDHGAHPATEFRRHTTIGARWYRSKGRISGASRAPVETTPMGLFRHGKARRTMATT